MRPDTAIIAAMVVAGVVCTTADAAAQSVPDVTVDVTGRVEYQFHTSSVEAVPSTTFEFRRARLGVRLGVGDAITGMIEPDFAQGDVRLRQAWINYAVDPAFEVRAGQFKKPFSRLELTSELNYPTIERSVRIRGLADSYATIDDGSGAPVLSRLEGPLLGEEQYLLGEQGYQSYDMGIAFHGQLGMVGYEAGVYNGTGENALDADEAKAVAGRITLAPIERLEFGAGVSRTDLALGELDATGVAWEVDAEWGGYREAGLRLLGEVAYGDNIASEDEFLGAQVLASWFAPLDLGGAEALEPVLRGSWGDPRRDIDVDAGLLVTPGLNLYFNGRNRLMVNWDVFMPEGDRFETEQSFKVHAQLSF